MRRIAVVFPKDAPGLSVVSKGILNSLQYAKKCFDEARATRLLPGEGHQNRTGVGVGGIAGYVCKVMHSPEQLLALEAERLERRRYTPLLFPPHAYFMSGLGVAYTQPHHDLERIADEPNASCL
jgi:hypothetical protein